jgi:UDP-arabinose 4-epimerase
MGAVDMLRALFPKPGHLQFLCVDLGDSQAVQEVFAKNAIDAVMHFAAVAYVGESMAEPLRLVISPSMPTTCS